MTTWVENPTGGRERGPRGIARAWVELLSRPRRFFTNGIAPGDQAPALSFIIIVTFIYTMTRFLLVPSARPEFFASELASVVVGLLLATVLIGPVALHLTAALQVIITIVFVRDRAGVSETVQVLAYATAPAAFAGIGVPPALTELSWLVTLVAAIRVLLALWGVGLLVVGMATVHDITLPHAAVVVAIPALIVFGYGFGGLFAAETLTGLELVRSTPPTG